jgi:hypothetical protein
MGLNFSSAEFLYSNAKRGISLGRLLVLGRQLVHMTLQQTKKVKHWTGVRLQPAGFADDFFRTLGATSISFLDYFEYEGARALSPSYGFEAERLLFRHAGLWYEANDPAAMVEIKTRKRYQGAFKTATAIGCWPIQGSAKLSDRSLGMPKPGGCGDSRTQASSGRLVQVFCEPGSSFAPLNPLAPPSTVSRQAVTHSTECGWLQS